MKFAAQYHPALEISNISWPTRRKVPLIWYERGDASGDNGKGKRTEERDVGQSNAVGKWETNCSIYISSSLCPTTNIISLQPTVDAAKHVKIFTSTQNEGTRSFKHTHIFARKLQSNRKPIKSFSMECQICNLFFN
ncbi:unnamed protein product [Dovyalis caffra]|uniref:Uncharacterized protein n=1 Tax=Dovyalis caffra TaxID=77055 RepID=A0AAV1SAB7_9ROSI|nr:unnamed protein product [Dovyalis caffra]